jgi:hypothetical protein
LRGSAARATARKAPRRRFCSTERRGNSRLPSGTRTTPSSTTRSGESPTKSTVLPSSVARTLPAVGRIWPMMLRIKVVLPLPLVPSSTTVSPAGTRRETPSSTRTAP